MADFDNTAPVIAGVARWPDCVVAFATNTALSAIIDGSTHQGVLLEMDQPVLLTGQSTPAENGVYLVKAAAAIRHTRADAAGEFPYGREVRVLGGNNAGLWVHVTTGTITLGTTGLTFIKAAAAGVPNVQDLVGGAFSNTAPTAATLP